MPQESMAQKRLRLPALTCGPLKVESPIRRLSVIGVGNDENLISSCPAEQVGRAGTGAIGNGDQTGPGNWGANLKIHLHLH